MTGVQFERDADNVCYRTARKGRDTVSLPTQAAVVQMFDAGAVVNV